VLIRASALRIALSVTHMDRLALFALCIRFTFDLSKRMLCGEAKGDI